MKVPVGSCESAIGAKQLTFMYGDIADRRHVRLEKYLVLVPMPV